MSTPLYGGAITAKLPAHLLDASNARPVPDSQEVWVSDHNGVIIDLLECVNGDNNPMNTHIEEMERLGGSKLLTDSEKTTTVNEPLVQLAVIRTFPNVERQFHLPSAVGLLRLKSPADVDVLITLTGVWDNPAMELESILQSFHVKDQSLFV